MRGNPGYMFQLVWESGLGNSIFSLTNLQIFLAEGALQLERPIPRLTVGIKKVDSSRKRQRDRLRKIESSAHIQERWTLLVGCGHVEKRETLNTRLEQSGIQSDCSHLALTLQF